MTPPRAERAVDDGLLASLPPGSELRQIAFVADPAADQTVLLEFPQTILKRAVVVDRSGAAAARPVPSGDLVVLTIPGAPDQEALLLATLREWIDAGLSAASPKSQMMILQGAQIFWNEGRFAILAQPERLDTIRTALVEVAFYDSELRDIERVLGEIWPQMEADMPLAFEFDDRAIAARPRLRQRFGQVLALRARLARIAPQVHCPHVHPPTLASQVGERLRERTRMGHRHEFLDEQIEVFEDVYEACGQRASDYMLTRSSNTLEWVIIVLLLVQILFTAFEYLVGTGTATGT